VESLSLKVIRSGTWSLTGNWLARGLGIIKMIVLARILTPQDFGVIGLAMLSIGCLNVFSEIGVESALIQKKDVGPDDLNTAWTITIIRGVVLFLVLYLAAEQIANYFSNASLKPVLQVIAICFVLEGLTNIGIIYYQKDIDFRQKVKLELLSDFCGSIVAILLALLLRNVWAIVFGSVVWRASYCFLSYRMHPFRPRIFWDSAKAGHLIHFGKHIFWITLVTFVVTNADDALVGKLLGLKVLGYYAMAYNIANIPVTSLAGIVGKISFPAYSLVQDDRKRLGEAFGRVFETTLIVLLPLAALIILVSGDFIRIFLGAKWLPMSIVLQILCLLGLFRGLSNVIAPVQLAVNRPELQSTSKTVELVIFLMLIYPFTVHWGIIGAGWAVTMVYLVSFVLNAIMTGLIIEGFAKILFRASLVPVAATIGLASATLLTQIELEGAMALFRFSAASISGAAVFGLVILFLNRRLIQDLFRRGLAQ